MDNIRELIKDRLYDAVNDIFAETQNLLGIEYGDISPLMELDLEDAKDAVVEVMIKVLDAQRDRED